MTDVDQSANIIRSSVASLRPLIDIASESVIFFAGIRRQVELFFKWIKQHLRIKAFYGTSENAVKTQIWIAVSVLVQPEME